MVARGEVQDRVACAAELGEEFRGAVAGGEIAEGDAEDLGAAGFGGVVQGRRAGGDVAIGGDGGMGEGATLGEKAEHADVAHVGGEVEGGGGY